MNNIKNKDIAQRSKYPKPLTNHFYLYDDLKRNVQSTVSKEPYILFYEKVEANQLNSSELQEEVPTFFQEQIEYNEATQKEFIYPTSIYYEFTNKCRLNPKLSYQNN